MINFLKALIFVYLIIGTGLGVYPLCDESNLTKKQTVFLVIISGPISWGLWIIIWCVFGCIKFVKYIQLKMILKWFWNDLLGD